MGKLFVIMKMHPFPVRKQDVEYSSVLLAVYDPSVIQDGQVCSVGAAHKLGKVGGKGRILRIPQRNMKGVFLAQI